MNQGGDMLARGAKSAQFPASEGVSQKKWDSIFADYNPETEYEVKKVDRPDSPFDRYAFPPIGRRGFAGGGRGKER